tara:strand:- start:22870 stop:22974 length:105 start_codon:yes stop_codon:yes gene_type:complete
MFALSIAWFELAAKAFNKKYANKPAKDDKEQQKQ